MPAEIISFDAWRNAPREIVRRTRIVSDAQYERERQLEDELRMATWAVESCEHRIKRVPGDAAKLQNRLDLVVFLKGPNKGQPLTAQRRKTLEQERDRWFKYLDEKVEALPGLKAELARVQRKVRAEGLQ